MEHYLVRFGSRFLTRNTKKCTVRKMVDTKFGQNISLKNGRVRYGNGKVFGKILESYCNANELIFCLTQAWFVAVMD